MPTRSIPLRGSYQNAGRIELAKGIILEWHSHDAELLPRIPYGTVMEVSIHFEERDYLNGTEGIVWATYDLRQAEIIRNALLSQNIACELAEEKLEQRLLHLLQIPQPNDTQAAIDYIWREKSGLRLKPDWNYPAGSKNESFSKWTNGV